MQSANHISMRTDHCPLNCALVMSLLEVNIPDKALVCTIYPVNEEPAVEASVGGSPFLEGLDAVAVLTRN